eukprot:8337869-Pyramimonas_sp.AAC.1
MSQFSGATSPARDGLAQSGCRASSSAAAAASPATGMRRSSSPSAPASTSVGTTATCLMKR